MHASVCELMHMHVLSTHGGCILAYQRPGMCRQVWGTYNLFFSPGWEHTIFFSLQAISSMTACLTMKSSTVTRTSDLSSTSNNWTHRGNSHRPMHRGMQQLLDRKWTVSLRFLSTMSFCTSCFVPLCIICSVCGLSPTSGTAVLGLFVFNNSKLGLV